MRLSSNPACGSAAPGRLSEARWLLVLGWQSGLMVSRDDLLREVRRVPFEPGANSVDRHICKLRRSLGLLGERVTIETARNRG